jgi:hypothetical protein
MRLLTLLPSAPSENSFPNFVRYKSTDLLQSLPTQETRDFYSQSSALRRRAPYAQNISKMHFRYFVPTCRNLCSIAPLIPPPA